MTRAGEVDTLAGMGPGSISRRSASDIRRRLWLLDQERALAHQCGLSGDPAYMADLDDEIAVTRSAFVGEAVTEIACLRAAIDGPLHG